MYSLCRSDDEIAAVLNAAGKAEAAGHSEWPGMTYEQGVKQALGWVVGDYDDNPMEA